MNERWMTPYGRSKILCVHFCRLNLVVPVFFLVFVDKMRDTLVNFYHLNHFCNLKICQIFQFIKKHANKFFKDDAVPPSDHLWMHRKFSCDHPKLKLWDNQQQNKTKWTGPMRNQTDHLIFHLIRIELRLYGRSPNTWKRFLLFCFFGPVGL